ncbi:MAG: tetratricopeptide repeat protein [Rhodoplanes sp.]|uniref:tetratricopeptide repeat protein n=1 Tax=Rhodoplanes sp. TaxID=1968906 RepID=UPI00183151DE|nr:tetratricopeptide repeat protein [Rhodoplanes sp.]NVO14205.1 tetratricopeptide repeat protein [Rhodoplanes sp.]
MSRRNRFPRLLASVALLGLLGASLAGCTTTGNTLGSALSSLGSGDRTGAVTTAAQPRGETDWRREAEIYGARYRTDPSDSTAAVAYARALTATGQRVQAVSVLEQTSLRNPNDQVLLGAYGRALADTGRFDQALEVLGRAHSPDRPDWRILSAQGTVLDQLGRHKDAQAYYASALKIVPDEPTVLSNLGLSYALAKDLPRAEATLRRAAARPTDDPRVRQNLALVVGLQGRFADAEDIAKAELPPDEASANVVYLREMLAQKGDWKQMGRPPKIAAKGQS